MFKLHAKKEIAPAIAGGLISAGGSLLGGLMGSSSAKSINRQQIALSREQMQFQERMSSTAYQRSAKDLEAAGLNRILALGSPASSPGGAQPPSLKVPGEYIQRGISSALQNAAVGAQIHLLTEQARGVGYKADIDHPKATLANEAGNLIDEIIVKSKKRGPSFIDSAIGTAKYMRSPHDRVKLSKFQRDRISKEADTLGKQIPTGDSRNLNLTQYEPSRMQEKSYRESNTPRQNLDAWIISFAKANKRKPSAEMQRRYLKYLKGNAQ